MSADELMALRACRRDERAHQHAGPAGSYAGKLALHRLPERTFRAVLKWTLTVLSLQLLYNAIGQLISGQTD